MRLKGPELGGCDGITEAPVSSHLVVTGTALLDAVDLIEPDAALAPRLIDSPSFKAWFGASHVHQPLVSSRQRREDAKPMVVYHGTNAVPEVFETGRPTVNDWGWLGVIETTRHGIFFAESPDYAETFIKHLVGGSVVPVYLSIQNPFYLDGQSLSDYYGDMAEKLDAAYDLDPATLVNAKANFERARWLYNLQDVWSVFDGEEGRAFVEWLVAEGYDGAHLEEVGHGLEDAPNQAVWVILSSTQAKSATGNCGAFASDGQDIRG